MFSSSGGKLNEMIILTVLMCLYVRLKDYNWLPNEKGKCMRRH